MKIKTGTKRFGSGMSSTQEPISYELFNHLSKNGISHVVSVTDKNPILISSFGLYTGVKIGVHKVLVKGGGYPEGCECGCDCIEGDDPSIRVSEPLQIDCKPVTINECNNVLYLTIPGFYMFRVNEEEHVGKFILLAEPVSQKDLPTGLVIGNRFSNEFVGI